MLGVWLIGLSVYRLMLVLSADRHIGWCHVSFYRFISVYRLMPVLSADRHIGLCHIPAPRLISWSVYRLLPYFGLSAYRLIGWSAHELIFTTNKPVHLFCQLMLNIGLSADARAICILFFVVFVVSGPCQNPSTLVFGRLSHTFVLSILLFFLLFLGIFFFWFQSFAEYPSTYFCSGASGMRLF